MSLKTSRIAALATTMAAVGAMSVATTSASAVTITQTFTNWEVEGSLTFNTHYSTCPVPLPATDALDTNNAGTFNGAATINLNPTGITGTLAGTFAIAPIPRVTGLACPPFEFTMTVGAANGTVNSTAPSNCPSPIAGSPDTCVNVSLPTNFKLEVTPPPPHQLSPFAGCQTIAPAPLPLSENETLLELITTGMHFTGSSSIPNWTCPPPFAAIKAHILDFLLSGPNNPYALNINPT